MTNRRTDAEQESGPPRATRGGRAATRELLPRVVTGALCLLLTAYMVGKFVNGDYKDTAVWYDAGRRVLNGQSLVGLPHYRYPPTFAVLVSPLCGLPFSGFFFLWYGINLVLFGLMVGVATRISCSCCEVVAPRQRWLGVLLVAPLAIDNLVLGQTNILITVLVYWALLEAARGREWLAGLPLGAAIAIKVFPVPLMAYFAYRLRVRVVAGGALSCAFFLLLMPGPVRGFGRNFHEVGDWAKRVVTPYLARGEAGDWGQHSLDFGNQSLLAVSRRYLTHVDAQVMARRERGAPSIYVNVADLSERQANAVLLAVCAGLALVFVASCGIRYPQDRQRRAVEHSLAVIILLLVSALAWTYFFVMLLLPVTAALCLLQERERLRCTTVWALRVALWGVALGTVLLVSQYVRALGGLFWAALVMFAALAMACRDLRRASAPAAPLQGEAQIRA